MSISVYTICTNAIRDEYYLIEGIRSALEFADEVIVMDGGSKDNTIEEVKKINDPRIKIYYNEWLNSLGKSMYAINKSLALGRCTSDWCIIFDSDEVFHEDDTEKIKRIPSHVGANIDAIEFNTLHFYKDYDNLLNGCEDWKDLYTKKIYMVRNGKCIHHSALGHDPDPLVNLHGEPIKGIVHFDINMYHYGHVRSKESYIRKVNAQHGRHAGWTIPEKKVEDFDWRQTDNMTKFTGTHPKFIKERIDSYGCN